MAHARQILENPISGEKIIFRNTAADTDGEPLAFELVVVQVEARAPAGAARASRAATSVAERAIRRATATRIAPRHKSRPRVG